MFSCNRILTVGACLLVAGTATAQVDYAGYTFDDDAFADRVVSNDGDIHVFTPATVTTLEEALLGFSPDTGLFNIGLTNPNGEVNSNDFTLFLMTSQQSMGPVLTSSSSRTASAATRTRSR